MQTALPRGSGQEALPALLQGSHKGEVAAIGTALKIQRHHRMDDGRMAIDNIGAPTTHMPSRTSWRQVSKGQVYTVCGWVMQVWTASR